MPQEDPVTKPQAAVTDDAVRHSSPATAAVVDHGKDRNRPVRRERSGHSSVVIRYSEPPVPATASPPAVAAKRGHRAAASSYYHAADGHVSAATSNTSSRPFQDAPPRPPPRPAASRAHSSAPACAAVNGSVSLHESPSATARPNGVFIGGKVRIRHQAAGSSSGGGGGGSAYAVDSNDAAASSSTSSRVIREPAAPPRHHPRPPKANGAPSSSAASAAPPREHGEDECHRLGVQAVMMMGPSELLAAITRYQLEQKAAAEAVGKKVFSFWPTNDERDFDLEVVDTKVGERRAAASAKGKRRRH